MWPVMFRFTCSIACWALLSADTILMIELLVSFTPSGGSHVGALTTVLVSIPTGRVITSPDSIDLPSYISRSMLEGSKANYVRNICLAHSEQSGKLLLLYPARVQRAN